MNDNRTLRSALWYAQNKKWFVIPLYSPIFENGECVGCSCETWRRKKVSTFICDTPGKHPRLADWEESASNDPNVIREWWRKWPDSNVGIAAGKSGLLVFDIDSYKDKYAGQKLLTSADEQTLTSLTGSGGTHLLYQMPEDAYYSNARGALPHGIDIRGFGGQFVAPPSMHPSGRRYQWESGYGPHEIDLLPLPQAIVEILDEYKAQQAQAVNFVYDVAPPDFASIRLKAEIIALINNPPAKGGRSEADQTVITALVRAGASDDEIKAIFVNYPIGKDGKMHDKGTHALQYLATSIGHARGWWQAKREEYIEQNTAKFFQAVAIG